MPAPQHVYDAIKQVRETGTAWVTWNGERLRLRPVVEADTGYRPGDEPQPEGLESTKSPIVGWCPGPYSAFIKSRSPGGIALAQVWWHEGRLHLEEGDGRKRRFRRGNDNIVLAIVAERHPRGEVS